MGERSISIRGTATNQHDREAATRKKKRITIRPACVGSILTVFYVVFVALVLNTLEDGPSGMGTGIAYHLVDSVTSSISSGVTSMSKLAGSMQAHHLSHDKSAESTFMALFCGECHWKDTAITCDERVAYEVKTKNIPEFESKKTNLADCMKPPDEIPGFCGECEWKNMGISCNERVSWEVKNKKSYLVEAQKGNLQHCKRPPYILSPLCGGCLRELTKKTSKLYRTGIPCYEIMHQRVQEGKAKTKIEAARMTAEEFPECWQCHPEKCWKNYFHDISMRTPLDEIQDKKKHSYLTKYWRFDEAAPKISTPTTLLFPSIPKELRIPPSRFQDIEAYLIEKFHEFEASNDKKHVPIFFEYNPSLTPVPLRMKKYLPKYTTYVMALRVTPANNCFRRETMVDLPQKVWDHTMMSPANLLGLALLDEEYELLPGNDIVVDIATQLDVQRNGYGTTYFGEPTFMDYRLFTLNDDIYLHANADVTVVTKIDLRSKKHSKKEGKGQYKLDIVYGEDNLEVTLLHQFNTIWSGGERGKNFALFSVPNRTHPHQPDSVYAEVDINPYHKVQQLYLDEFEMLERSVVKKRIRRNYAVDEIMMRKVASNGNLTTSEIEPRQSFFTIDEHWFPGIRGSFRRAGHGGACCVSLTRREALQGGHIKLPRRAWADDDYLLVGVAHTSVQWRKWYSKKAVPAREKVMVPHTHYVSFFYAFEPQPPFNLRALSGYFCLGFAGDAGTERGPFNPNSILTGNRKLSQNNETFRCPQIHFISSFIEKVDEPSTTVIGYGINDCTSRIVEVSKREITRLLFSDPWEMKIERSKDTRAESLDSLRGPMWGEA